MSDNRPSKQHETGNSSETPTYEFRQLAGGEKQVVITLGDKTYRLIETRAGGLVLNK